MSDLPARSNASPRSVMRAILWGKIIAAMLFCLSCSKGEVISDDDAMPEQFVVVNDEIPSLVFDIRYYSNDNFLGTKVRGYESANCILTKAASEALKKVQEEISEKGYTLKIFDCYRPQQAVDHFVEWVNDADDQKMKAEYYPDEDKTLLIQKGYIADKSGHSRGSTLDLTLVEHDSATELDMGTPFDYFDTLSNTADPRMTEQQKHNRLLLKSAMENHGFVNYDKEWWHYTLKDEPYPDTYFNFSVK